MTEGAVIETLGEAGLLLRFPDPDPLAANARVHALTRRLDGDRHPDVRELVPAYASLAVLFDPGADPAGLRAALRTWLERALLEDAQAAPVPDPRLHTLRVRYGGEDGPDLAAVAAHAGMAPDEVVARHCAPTYTVAMLGFAPGFPYLLGLDPRLAMPRLGAPRPRVAAGSVALAGTQGGIYPQAGPGGWRLLGRTDAALFEAARTPPALLAPGDLLRFEPA